jgi:eukaryotic-like serine/threonine-protein kinase
MSLPFDSRTTAQNQPTVLDVQAAGGDPNQTLQPGLRLGPYRIERLLGEGGMGAVYLADQLEPLQRPVALKLIRGQLRGGLAEAYFLVERQALARMDHPAIAKVYDAGTTPQGHPFFAMEWIDGPSLAAYCAVHALSLDDTLALFSRICLGVHHAHQKGVIHRDLKPNNVLIASVDGEPFPKIIDFGIAIGATKSIAGEGMPLMERAGTRGYMSPEQLHGTTGEIDIRSDIYALGVMLLELVAPPEMMDNAAIAGLDNRGLHAALLASLGQPATAPADIVRQITSIPTQLRWLLARAIDPERTRRYDSAQALADDLDRYRRHYPLSAVPPTRTYRLRAFAVRNRGPILAVGLVVFALIAGTTAAVIGMVHARAAAERATIEANKSRETSKFLTDVLSGVDPQQARDLDKTLLHLVLDRAASRASQELAGQPEVLADIEHTIGSSYNSLSEYKTALAHTSHAYDLARTSLGPEALLTLQIERQLSRETLNSGDAKQASEIITRNVATLARTRGADDEETLRSAVDSADIENEKGDFAVAEHQMAELMPTIERVSGPDGPLTLDALEIRAELLTYLGRYTQAEPMFRDVVQRDTRLLGAEDSKTIGAMNSFAIMYLESERFAEGAKILQEMLPICEKIYGPEHGMTLNVVSNLGGALRQQGTPEKIAESGPYYKRALDETHKKYGDKHPNVIRATHNYANYLLDIGDTAQAINLQQQVVAQAKQVFGPEHEVTGEGEFGLGKALLKAGRYAEAEQSLLAAVAEKQKDFGADHWRLGEYMTPLIETYRAWDKPQQAAQWEAKRAALKTKPAAET